MRLPHCLLGHRALQGISGALAACPPPPGVDYTLNGASLRVEAGRNLTIVGAGYGATITRGQTSGRLIEVLSARLELRNVYLEGGRAQVRALLLHERGGVHWALRAYGAGRTTAKRHAMTRYAFAAGGRRSPCERPQRRIGHQKLHNCQLPRRGEGLAHGFRY